jgi:hypothetical protein
MKTSGYLQAPVALSPLLGFWSLSGCFGKRSTLAPTGKIETRLIGGPARSLIPYTYWAILAPQFIYNSRGKTKQSTRQNVFESYRKSQSNINSTLYLVGSSSNLAWTYDNFLCLPHKRFYHDKSRYHVKVIASELKECLYVVYTKNQSRTG